MSEKTEIAWTDSTFNPWWGCTKISPGCDNCYAQALDKRTGGAHWGAGVERRRTSEHNWNDPVRWNKKADSFFAKHGRRQRVFCASMADVFDNEVDPQWRVDLFNLIVLTPNLDWLLLTKRIGNVALMLKDMGGAPLPSNVWLGSTICNQAEAYRDIPKLLAVPAAKRFLSMEPLLGPVDLKFRIVNTNPPAGIESMTPAQVNEHAMVIARAMYHAMCDMVEWVIVGGESGPNARPMHSDWVRSLRDQCVAAGVPYFFKQWGEWAPHQTVPGGNEGGDVRRSHVRYLQGDGREPDGHFRKGDAAVARVGKKAAGCLLDGIKWNGAPA
jgi:protein gp37